MGRLLETYRAISALPAAHPPSLKTPEQEMVYLYQVLSILDSKASALMRFDAILIAASSFILNDPTRINDFPTAKPIVLLILLMSLVAAALCLFVVQVSYPFLGEVDISASPPNCTPELEKLDAAHEFRRKCYQGAWWLSLFAVAIGFLQGVLLTLPMMAPAAK